MKTPLFAKIFVGYAAVFGVALVVLSALFNTSVREHYLDTLATRLEQLGNVLALQAEPYVRAKDFDALENFVRESGRRSGARITVIDVDGAVLADSQENAREMENHADRPEIIQALTNAVGRSLRHSSTMKKEMLYVAAPIPRDGRVVCVMRVSMFARDIDFLLSNLRTKLMALALITAALSLLVAVVVARSVAKPVSELTAAARAVAEGDFDVRVVPKRRDEVGELAARFNEMVGRIDELVTELSRQKTDLDTILSGLREGLLVLDVDGEALLVNASFNSLLACDIRKNTRYWEGIRHPEFTELVERVTREKHNARAEMVVNDRNLTCSALFSAGPGHVVITVHDITEIMTAAKVKKDLVTNVSHELRTPLTSMKGYIETLAESVDEQSKRYVDIIARNTDRLVNIVNDLLVLSELERSEPALEWEDVDLRVVTENVVAGFETRFRDKGLSVLIEAVDNLPAIKGDPFKLEQLFVNLIDNALKYTETGGITIDIARGDNALIVRVEDTGIGIPAKDLPRVFERFYVVDKSRSRRMGGTGLGLSIAKHITTLHHGKIEVESTVGEGTAFILTFPA